MNPSTINGLIEVRERLTNRRDEQVDFYSVGLIDAMLCEVPAGEDNRVDLLLGRLCATLEKYAPRPGWSVNPTVTLEDDETHRLIEITKRIWNETRPVEY